MIHDDTDGNEYYKFTIVWEDYKNQLFEEVLIAVDTEHAEERLWNSIGGDIRKVIQIVKGERHYVNQLR